jgi:hypothetical protein
MSEQVNKPDRGHVPEVRKPYVAPALKRVDLALAETLAAGCKLSGTCDDPFDPVSAAGS